MASCILAIYRSATGPVMAALGEELPGAAVRPGMVLFPMADPYSGGEERVRWGADRAGAQLCTLAGVGHWWMMQDPVAGARALESFWAGLGPDD
jgi:hypothetical protein